MSNLKVPSQLSSTKEIKLKEYYRKRAFVSLVDEQSYCCIRRKRVLNRTVTFPLKVRSNCCLLLRGDAFTHCKGGTGEYLSTVKWFWTYSCKFYFCLNNKTCNRFFLKTNNLCSSQHRFLGAGSPEGSAERTVEALDVESRGAFGYK